MESEILKFICANQGAVNTDFLVCNLGCSVSEILSSSDKFVPCCPFGQPKVVARTTLRLCRTKDCPGSCRGLHLCKSFLFSGSCQFTQTRRGCVFSHTLHSAPNGQILKEHGLEGLSRAELCTLLLQSDDHLLPQICHDYNTGEGVFGGCQQGLACKRLHVCERHLHLDGSCSRNHNFGVPHTLNLLQGVPRDLSLKSVYANKQALRYHDFQSNKAKRGNTNLRGNRGNRGRGGRRRGRFIKPTVLTVAKADVNKSVDCDGQLEGSSDDEQEPAEGAVAATKVGAKSCEGPLLLVIPQPQSPAKHQQPSEGGVAALSVGDNHQQLPQTRPADNSGAPQQLQSTSSVGPAPLSPTHPLIQRASATDVVSAAVEAGPQPIHPQTTLATTEGKRDIGSTHQPLQVASATGDTTAAVSGNAGENNSSNSLKTQQLLIDQTEICEDFLKGYCKHEERCSKAHDRMPYRWEINKNGQWTPLSDNEQIEKDFCDPKTTCSSSFPHIRFDTMTSGWRKFRRIDAGNSLLEPDFRLATEWLWYWEDEIGQWNTYASPDGGHKQADVDSSFLEQRFLADANDVLTFKAGSQTYSLSFKDMVQKNIIYGTKKQVRRRPRFVSAADVQKGRLSKPGRHASSAIPNHWDKTQLPQTGYQRVPLVSSSEEYQEVKALFCKTMRGFSIVKIERIQNKTLWDFFQLQKTQMKNSNGGRSVLEMKLFHGTDNKYVDTICHTNFDWRLCGCHGTAYGKGSYFALNGKYSHSYTSDSDVRSMFVVRLLVGEYTKGSPEYRRPPSKDGGDINFYDSCVDDVHHPSIYVVFDKHQIYPEYLLQYQEHGAGIHYTTSVRASGISQSSYFYQPSQPTIPPQKPTLSFSNTAASSSQSNQAKSTEKSCIIS